MAEIDWLAIEGEYRGTDTPLRELASRYGTKESTIRARAKKHGWHRDPAGSKRALVDAALSGIARNAQGIAQNAMADEAEQDIADMRLSLEVNRTILTKAKAMAQLIDEPQPLKVIAEATRIATDTIRRIRKLDEVTDTAITIERR